MTQFAEHPWRPAPVSGSPVLADGLAFLDCCASERLEGGDHSILLGEVLDLGTLDGTVPSCSSAAAPTSSQTDAMSESQAEVVRAALDAFLERERRQVEGEAIAEGYGRIPQSEGEVALAEAAARASILEDPW